MHQLCATLHSSATMFRGRSLVDLLCCWQALVIRLCAVTSVSIGIL